MNKIGKSFSPYSGSSDNGLKFAMDVAKKLQQQSRNVKLNNQKSEESVQNKPIENKSSSQFKSLSDNQIKQMLKMAQRQNKTLKNKVNQSTPIQKIVEEVNKENQEYKSNINDDLFPDF